MCVGGVILCLGAREREQHKEEEADNITRVVKRSKREQQGSVWVGGWVGWGGGVES